MFIVVKTSDTGNRILNVNNITDVQEVLMGSVIYLGSESISTDIPFETLIEILQAVEVK